MNTSQGSPSVVRVHLQGFLLTEACSTWLRPCSERRGGKSQQLCQPEPARMLLIKHNEAWDPRTLLLIQGSREARQGCRLAVERAGHGGDVLGKGEEMEPDTSTATPRCCMRGGKNLRSLCSSWWSGTTHGSLGSLGLSVPREWNQPLAA